jgi:hypothetical protein
VVGSIATAKVISLASPTDHFELPEPSSLSVLDIRTHLTDHVIVLAEHQIA